MEYLKPPDIESNKMIHKKWDGPINNSVETKIVCDGELKYNIYIEGNICSKCGYYDGPK